MSAGQLPPPGTVLRKYDRNGAVRCEAVVGQNGQVIYRGVTYSSISAAAKVAAGDIGLAARSCDGYAFFGLKGRDGGATAPRAPRSAGVPPQVPAVSLPLPLPVRWDELPSAAAAPATQPLRTPPPHVIKAIIHAPHIGHGRADASGAPLDPDCSCRGGADEEECAEAGCGFCRAAQAMARLTGSAPTAPVVDPKQHRWDRGGEQCLDCGTKDWMGGSCAPVSSVPIVVGHNAEDGVNPGAPIYRRNPIPVGCENCAGCPDCLTNKVLAAGISAIADQVCFPGDKTAVLSLAPDSEPLSPVDLKQRGAASLQTLDDLSGKARRALDLAYDNLACSTNHKPDRETFRKLWVERELPAGGFDIWAASRTWWDREPIDDWPLPEHSGEPIVGREARAVVQEMAAPTAPAPQDPPRIVERDLPGDPAIHSGPVPAEALAALDETEREDALACNMIVGHKAVFDRDKEGRIVGVEPGDEIECGMPAVKQVVGDPETRLCAGCAIVWDVDRLGELEPITVLRAESASLRDGMTPEEVVADEMDCRALDHEAASARGEMLDDLAPIIDEQARAESAARMLREPDARSAQESLPALLASTVDHRDVLGQRVREVWDVWAREQPAPKPSWLLPWEALSEPEREVDRRIGEALFTMGADAEAFTTRITAASARSTLAEIRDALIAAVEGDVDPDEQLVGTLKRIVRQRDAAREEAQRFLCERDAALAGKQAVDVSKDVSKVRADLLAKIDAVIMGTPFWQGGRLDTIKYLLARVETAEAMRESAYAFVRTVQVGGQLHTMHLAPLTPGDHDNGPWTWSCRCGASLHALPFIGLAYDNPEDGWRAVDEWERAETPMIPASSTEGERVDADAVASPSENHRE